MAAHDIHPPAARWRVQLLGGLWVGDGQQQFTRLPSRDRAALQQSQTEKYPQEYGPLVEQYLRNLSDQATDK